MSLPVGVQVYSVRDDAKADLALTLKKIKDMGYDGVEFAGLYGHGAKEVKAMCGEYGLVPVSAHVPLAEMLADTEKVMSDYAEIGCGYIAVPYLPPELRPGTDNFTSTVENIKKLGAAAKAHGIQLLYHNHDFEFVKIGDEFALDMLYRTVSADLLKTELDTCWVKVAGQSPVGYLAKYSGRAPVVHLKDFAGQKAQNMYELIGIAKKAEAPEGEFEFRPVGYGVQDFYSILGASEKAGAKWVVVEQDKPSMGKTPLESIKLSRDWLRTLGW